MVKIALLFSFYLGLASISFAQTDLSKFTAHQASYDAEITKGLNLSGTAIRKLQQNPDHTWSYSFTVDTLPAEISESSHFQVSNGRIEPLSYRYKLSGMLIKDRKQTVNFDQTTKTLSEKYKDKHWSLEYPSETLDRLSYQLQLQQDIASLSEKAATNERLIGDSEFLYSVIHKGKFREYKFKSTRVETLDTQIGPKDAILVEKVRSEDKKRQTKLWFDKDHPHLLLRMVQTEEDGERYEINIRSID